MKTIYNICRENLELSEREYKKYRHYIDDFMNFINDKLLEGDIIDLPFRLGRLAITGRKMKIKEGKPIAKPNWKATKELWKRDEQARKEKKLVYFLNTHTNNINYRYDWITFNKYLINKNIYKFVPTYTNRKKLSKKIIENNTEYLVL